MSEIVSVVDYGAGNIASIRNSLKSLGVESKVVRTPEEILVAGRL